MQMMPSSMHTCLELSRIHGLALVISQKPLVPDSARNASSPMNMGLSMFNDAFSKRDLRTIDPDRDMPHLCVRKALVCPSDQSKPRVTGGRRVTGLTRVSRAARGELLGAYFFGVIESAVLADMKCVRR